MELQRKYKRPSEVEVASGIENGVGVSSRVVVVKSWKVASDFVSWIEIACGVAVVLVSGVEKSCGWSGVTSGGIVASEVVSGVEKWSWSCK